MAALAADMKQLKSFLHVSTAYVNCFLGRQKHVEERQYELMHNGKPMCHAAVIEELQSLVPDQAEKRVSAAWPEHHACNLCWVSFTVVSEVEFQAVASARTPSCARQGHACQPEAA